MSVSTTSWAVTLPLFLTHNLYSTCAPVIGSLLYRDRDLVTWRSRVGVMTESLCVAMLSPGFASWSLVVMTAVLVRIPVGGAVSVIRTVR